MKEQSRKQLSIRESNNGAEHASSTGHQKVDINASHDLTENLQMQQTSPQQMYDSVLLLLTKRAPTKQNYRELFEYIVNAMKATRKGNEGWQMDYAMHQFTLMIRTYKSQVLRKEVKKIIPTYLYALEEQLKEMLALISQYDEEIVLYKKKYINGSKEKRANRGSFSELNKQTFPDHQRNIIFHVVRELRSRIVFYGGKGVTGKEYKTGYMDIIYDRMLEESSFSRIFDELHKLYGIGNTKTLIYALKRSKPQNLERILAKYYRIFEEQKRQALELKKNGADKLGIVDANVKEKFNRSDSEQANSLASLDADIYALRGGEIVPPDDANDNNREDSND